MATMQTWDEMMELCLSRACRAKRAGLPEVEEWWLAQLTKLRVEAEKHMAAAMTET